MHTLLIALAVGAPPADEAVHVEVRALQEITAEPQQVQQQRAAEQQLLRQQYLARRKAEMDRRRRNARLRGYQRRSSGYAGTYRARQATMASVNAAAAQQYTLHRLAVSRFYGALVPRTPSCHASRAR